MKKRVLLALLPLCVLCGCKSNQSQAPLIPEYHKVFGTCIPRIGPAEAIAIARKAIASGVCKPDGISDDKNLTSETVTYIVPNGGDGAILVEFSINGTRKSVGDHDEVEERLQIYLDLAGNHREHHLRDVNISIQTEGLNNPFERTP